MGGIFPLGPAGVALAAPYPPPQPSPARGEGAKGRGKRRGCWCCVSFPGQVSAQRERRAGVQRKAPPKALQSLRAATQRGGSERWSRDDGFAGPLRWTPALRSSCAFAWQGKEREGGRRDGRHAPQVRQPVRQSVPMARGGRGGCLYLIREQQSGPLWRDQFFWRAMSELLRHYAGEGFRDRSSDVIFSFRSPAPRFVRREPTRAPG